MSTVNVGVIGVGNCASSLVQGVEYYSNTAARPAGLTNAVCADYAVSDVRFTSAFDVNVSKIGSDLSEAIWAAPNNALKFADVPRPCRYASNPSRRHCSRSTTRCAAGCSSSGCRGPALPSSARTGSSSRAGTGGANVNHRRTREHLCRYRR